MKKKTDIINREYLYYLISDLGILNDYELYKAGISFDEFDNPNEQVFEKLENYRDKKSRD